MCIMCYVLCVQDGIIVVVIIILLLSFHYTETERQREVRTIHAFVTIQLKRCKYLCDCNINVMIIGHKINPQQRTTEHRATHTAHSMTDVAALYIRNSLFSPFFSSIYNFNFNSTVI